MSDFTITVIGTGVIGTSIGLALKQQKDPPRLLAHDKELGNAKAAVKKGAFDKAEWNLVNACEPADLIILAIPLDGIQFTLEAIASHVKQGVIISDTCRSKGPILDWASKLLPSHAHYVGGDPVVHPAGPGYEHATADLFRNRLYCLVTAPSTGEDAIQLMTGLVTLLGAEPFFLDAVEHDGLVTATEHLPSLLSVALLQTLSEPRAWRETRKLAGGLFEQVSSGASGDPDALKDEFLENSDTLVHWLDRYMDQLSELRALLTAEDKGEELVKKIDKAIVSRLDWQADYQKGRFIDSELAPPQIEKPSFFNQLIGLGTFRKRRSGSSKK